MATPPKITRVELVQTITRIVNRRIKVDDPDRELLPAPEQADPSEVLAYLQKHTRVPGWVLDADVTDALRLCVWLWWEDRRRQLYWLQRGKARKLFLRHLGSELGIRSRSGVNDRIDRYSALLRFDRPDEKLSREERRLARQADLQSDAEWGWIRRHEEVLHKLAQGLLTAAERYGPVDDEDRQWLDELATDAREGFSPASMSVLGLAVDELRSFPGVLALDSSGRHDVQKLLVVAGELRTDFADVGKHVDRKTAAKQQSSRNAG